jgi:hypothetical protein
VFRRGKQGRAPVPDARYISPDVDQHQQEEAWKVFDREGQREGTWDWDLEKRLGK